nr:MAG TPA: hypothetical protein [Caudoviricetes sp.]
MLITPLLSLLLIINRSGQNLDEYPDVPIHSFLT